MLTRDFLGNFPGLQVCHFSFRLAALHWDLIEQSLGTAEQTLLHLNGPKKKPKAWNSLSPDLLNMSKFRTCDLKYVAWSSKWSWNMNKFRTYVQRNLNNLWMIDILGFDKPFLLKLFIKMSDTLKCFKRRTVKLFNALHLCYI